MKTITNRKLATIMIVSGLILMLITALYFIFQSSQWMQNNSRWFLFTDGIVVLILGLVFLIPTKKENKK